MSQTSYNILNYKNISEIAKIEEITEEQPKFEVCDSSAPEVTLDEAAQALQEDDPWMKRNLEKKAAEAAAAAGASSDATSN